MKGGSVPRRTFLKGLGLTAISPVVLAGTAGAAVDKSELYWKQGDGCYGKPIESGELLAEIEDVSPWGYVIKNVSGHDIKISRDGEPWQRMSVGEWWLYNESMPKVFAAAKI